MLLSEEEGELTGSSDIEEESRSCLPGCSSRVEAPSQVLWVSEKCYRLAVGDEDGFYIDQESKVKFPLHESLTVKGLVVPHSELRLKYRVVFCRVNREWQSISFVLVETNIFSGRRIRIQACHMCRTVRHTYLRIGMLPQVRRSDRGRSCQV